MKNVYRALAYVIAGLVVVQAGAIAYAVFGLGSYIEGGGTVDKSTESFPGLEGLIVHGMVGQMVVPAVTLLFLISSFFAHVQGGVKWALIVLGAVAVQIALGMFASGPAVGALHGGWALILFGLAVTAALRVGRSAAATAADAERVGATVS